jgi:hypothetical protein
MLRRVDSALFEAPVGARIQVVAQSQDNNGVNEAHFAYAGRPLQTETFLGLPGCSFTVLGTVSRLQAVAIYGPNAPESARYDLFEVENGAMAHLGALNKDSESTASISFTIHPVLVGAAVTAAVARPAAPGRAEKKKPAVPKPAAKRATRRPATKRKRAKGISRQPGEPAAEPRKTAVDVEQMLAAVPHASRSDADAARMIAVPEAEPVDASVFCPPGVARDSVFMVQVFLYPPRAEAAVESQALRADPTSAHRGSYSLPLDLRHGTRVDLHLEAPALTVAEPDAVIIWRGRPVSTQFEVGVSADVKGLNAIARVRFAIEGVPAGTLRFQVALVAAGTSAERAAPRELRGVRYRRAFVSYASPDRPEVLRRVQAFKIAGMSVFQDVLDLDPGERWERALYREIDACDVFLLFWSRAAASSGWVAKEIDYALARKHGDEDRPPDIQPVPIEGPPVVPPPERLKALHFNDALLAQINTATPSGPGSLAKSG